MFKPAKLLGSVRIARLVDESGHVFCPVKVKDVDVERCVSCPSLGSIQRGDSGELAEIRCQPSLSTLITASSR